MKKRDEIWVNLILILILILMVMVLLVGCINTIQLPQMQTQPFPTSSLVPTTLQKETSHPILIFVDPQLPAAFRNQLNSNDEIHFIESMTNSYVYLTYSDESVGMDWVYALVAPFPTIMDGVSLEDLKKAWNGDFSSNPINKPVLMTEETEHIFSILWGNPAEHGVKILESEKLEVLAWHDLPNWAIVPFEELNPKWKVLKIDGKSPLERNFSIDDYPLIMHFGFQGDEDSLSQLNTYVESNSSINEFSNRDASLLSVVMLTGTTALTRDIGKKMDAKGVMYPAMDIMEWFSQADIIHISNEVSFMTGCDLRDRLKFCSKPEYLRLLTGIGTGIVELTGNHLLDYGVAPFLFTLNLYDQNHIMYYGGGKDLEKAQTPILIENHGNKIAFLGCNYGFPEDAIATSSTAGVNPCNNEWMKSTIQGLKEDDYLIIFTFQDMESCTIEPLISQKGDFFQAAEAGADIVSGSQSHCPQTMTFYKGAFIHYGLGNFLFDQMGSLERREMVDFHYFYNGRYISTRILTGILEDSAKPRPMTVEERENLLYQVFEYSIWEK